MDYIFELWILSFLGSYMAFCVNFILSVFTSNADYITYMIFGFCPMFTILINILVLAVFGRIGLFFAHIIINNYIIHNIVSIGGLTYIILKRLINPT